MTAGERRFDILALGEPMVELNQHRRDDERQYLRGFGGDTSNAAIAAARQGAKVAYLSRLGDDAFGHALRALWQAEGVDDHAVPTDAKARTGLYFVHHGPQGHQFTYYRAGSAASLMQPADVPAHLIEQARVLHVSGISQAISDSACATVAHAIALARAMGTTVSYDPNLRLALWPLERAREVICATAALADEFLPSIDDVRAISGLQEPADIIRWAHGLGAKHVVLKLGVEGALVSDGRECTPVAAYRVNAVDATGAGDCFDGSYLHRRCLGETPVHAARWACAAAALATTGYGATEPLPRREQVEQFLRARS